MSGYFIKVPRDEVYRVIDGERDYQDAGLGNSKRHPDQPATMTPGEYLLCMEEVLSDGRKVWYKPDGSQACLDYVRKLAALCVACMQIHGAPARA